MVDLAGFPPPGWLKEVNKFDNPTMQEGDPVPSVTPKCKTGFVYYVMDLTHCFNFKQFRQSPQLFRIEQLLRVVIR